MEEAYPKKIIVEQAHYLGITARRIPYDIDISFLDNELQNWSVFRFKSPSGSDAKDQRGRDVKFSRRSYDIAIDFWKNFLELRDGRCEDRQTNEANCPEFELEKEGPVGGEEGSKEDRFLRGR